MSLSVGIVGLPNVGKSTLFNALLKKQQAFVANYPFATIEPNIGIVPVPDERLRKLAEVIKVSEGLSELPPEVNATVEFVDIAGLVAGAHKGEGLGNKFLSHIREVDVICHVVRDFSDGDIARAGSENPKNDFQVIETELALADLQTLEKQVAPRGNFTKEDSHRWEAVSKLRVNLEKGLPARVADLTKEELIAAKGLNLLTMKQIIVAINTDEGKLKDSASFEGEIAKELGILPSQVVAISAKVEMELSELSPEDQEIYLSDLGVTESGLERLIKKAFTTLGLITFLTAGAKEVRAWTIKTGTLAPKAAGVIHTDFEANFIKADCVNFADFVNLGGWRKVREAGKVRSEGKDYEVKDGDVIEFKVGI